MDMNHLEYIDQVAMTDCEEVRRKESTYEGSWKKRGGVGAFMMMARKWDRLEPMCQRRHYDVFDQPGDGRDGTLIAEIRDLRRYLLLVEAELMSTGKISNKRSGVGHYDVSEFINTDDPGAFTHDPWPPKPTPENGSQHESLHPWVVSAEFAAQYSDFYRRVSSDRYVLEPAVDGLVVPSPLQGLYVVTGYGPVIQIEHCPPGARDYFPVLQSEVNHFELKKLPAWHQRLYEWDSAADKYRVRDQAWLINESATA